MVELQKKTMNLIHGSSHNHSIFCWSQWEGNNNFYYFKKKFIESGIKIHDYSNKKFFFLLVIKLLRTCKKENINIIHAYFDIGILIAVFAKLLNRDLKVVVSFVGSESSSNKLLNFILNISFKFVSNFIYISDYVKKEKFDVFDSLKKIQ